MKQKLLLLSIFIFAFTAFITAQQVSIISHNTPANTDNCNPIVITVNGQYGCNNWQFSQTNSYVSNDTIFADIFYNAGLICTPAIGFFTHNINLGQPSSNNYIVMIRTFLNGNQEDFNFAPMNVAGCCDATSSFTVDNNLLCENYNTPFNFTNTSTGTITATDWYINGSLVANTADFDTIINTPGSYTIELIVSGTACQDTSDMIVVVSNTPNASLGPDVNACEGNSILLSVESGFPSYQWNVTNLSTSNVSVDTTGTYWVTATNADGCADADTIEVVFYPSPSQFLGNDTSFCENEEFTIDAGLFNNYDWSTFENTQTISVSNPGLYFVEVIDSNNCVGRDSINLMHLTAPTIDLGQDQIICAGSSFEFDAGMHQSYQWNDNSSASTLEANTTGWYSVLVGNADGCFESDSVYLDVVDNPIIDLGTDLSLCADSSIIVDLSTDNTYMWFDNSMGNSITLDNNNLNIGANEIWVEVTDSNACMSSDTLMLTFIDCDTTNLRDISQHLAVQIYPNPTSAKLQLDFDDTYTSLEMTIFNSIGQAIQQENYTNTSTIQTDLSELSNGIYTINIIIDQKWRANYLVHKQ